MHSEAAWSKLSHTPVILYSKKVDGYLAYWFGIGMTRNMALSLAGTFYLRVWASPQVKLKLWEEFQRIYYAGGFDGFEWDKMLKEFRVADDYVHERYYSYISNKVHDAIIKENASKRDPQEVLEWFKHDKALIVD